MNARKNSFPFGLILGIILPVVMWFTIFLFRIETFKTVKGFIDFLIEFDIYTAMMSLCVIPNLVLFFVFMRFNAMLSARGVILATLIYGFLVFGLYYLT